MTDCMYALPHELTGMGTMCGLFKGKLACNKLGKKCTGYHAHTAQSRKILSEVLAEKRKREQEVEDGE